MRSRVAASLIGFALLCAVGALGVRLPAADQNPNFELKKRQLDSWVAGLETRTGNWWLNVTPEFLDVTPGVKRIIAIAIKMAYLDGISDGTIVYVGAVSQAWRRDVPPVQDDREWNRRLDRIAADFGRYWPKGRNGTR